MSNSCLLAMQADMIFVKKYLFLCEIKIGPEPVKIGDRTANCVSTLGGLISSAR